MIAKEVKSLLGILCSERMYLDDQLFPYKASAYYNQVHIHDMYMYMCVQVCMCVCSQLTNVVITDQGKRA